MQKSIFSKYFRVCAVTVLLAILVLMTVMNEGVNRAASRQSVLRAARQRAS